MVCRRGADLRPFLAPLAWPSQRPAVARAAIHMVLVMVVAAVALRSVAAWSDIAGALTYKGTHHVFQGAKRPARPAAGPVTRRARLAFLPDSAPWPSPP